MCCFIASPPPSSPPRQMRRNQCCFGHALADGDGEEPPRAAPASPPEPPPSSAQGVGWVQKGRKCPWGGKGGLDGGHRLMGGRSIWQCLSERQRRHEPQRRRSKLGVGDFLSFFLFLTQTTCQPFLFPNAPLCNVALFWCPRGPARGREREDHRAAVGWGPGTPNPTNSTTSVLGANEQSQMSLGKSDPRAWSSLGSRCNLVLITGRGQKHLGLHIKLMGWSRAELGAAGEDGGGIGVV